MTVLKLLKRSLHLKQKPRGHSCSSLYPIELGLPPPPEKLFERREAFAAAVEGHLLHTSGDNDTPLDCLYRMYIHLMLDQRQLFLDETDHFWRRGWQIETIPEPSGNDHTTWAVLACITQALTAAFYQRIVKKQGGSIEDVPSWAMDVEPLSTVLKVPFWDPKKKKWTQIADSGDPRAWFVFKEKNILLVSPDLDVQ
jgi:hypothetical protein